MRNIHHLMKMFVSGDNDNALRALTEIMLCLVANLFLSCCLPVVSDKDFYFYYKNDKKKFFLHL